MPETSVVVDTSPLMCLHLTGHFSVPHELYETIIVPAAVQRELEAGQSQDFDVPSIKDFPWINVQ